MFMSFDASGPDLPLCLFPFLYFLPYHIYICGFFYCHAPRVTLQLGDAKFEINFNFDTAQNHFILL